MTPYRETFQVDFADCDPARIVFYPNYFQWFDRSSERMFRSRGLDWNEMWPAYDLVGLPIVEATAKFLAPSRMGDTITVESWVGEWKGKVFVVEHRVINGDKTTVEGREVRVWGIRDPDHPAGMRAAPVPDDIIARMEG